MSEELEVSGPGGIKAAFKGQQMFAVILVFIVSFVFGYLFFQHDSRADERNRTQVEATKTLTQAVESQAEAQQVMIYVLSLPPEERAKLRLAEPKALREMRR